MKTIFTALSPNLQKDDLKLSQHLIFRPKKWIHGKAEKELEELLSQAFNVKKVSLYESGRTALFTALKALDIKEGDEVILQAYTCVAVPEPILWLGATPIYVDIDNQSLNMDIEKLERKISSRTKAIIVQHTFGNPADMEKIMNIARLKNIPVIEDCAHSIGAKYEGKALGTFGDMAFFSFGRDKVVSSVFGGALISNNENLIAKIERGNRRYRYPSRIWVKRQLLHPTISAMVKKTYNSLGLGKLILKLSRKFHLTSDAVQKTERSGGKPKFIGHKMPNALASLAAHQLRKLAHFNHHREKIAQIYQDKLDPRIPRQLRKNGSICLRYLIRVDKPAKLAKIAKKEKVILGDWYQQVIAPEGVDYEKIAFAPSQFPVASQVASQSINLPTDINTNEKDAHRIVKIVNKFHDSL
ncbi:MAG: aminotransferase class I/II-fold pyridoxal phosphate-dependent enzyme [bacterium]|nr:aminotransferase class I/II-fold pyridoxal phosphate-dependent enzyme [bacterium]